MIDRRFLTLAFLLLGGSQAFGQTAKSGVRTAAEPSEPVQVTRLSDPYMPSAASEDRYRPLTAQAPAPYDPDAEYGFRNPGGIGRVREFYPPGNVFERTGDRVRTARFDEGPAATSRPLNFGFGYGYGLGGYRYGSRLPY